MSDNQSLPSRESILKHRNPKTTGISRPVLRQTVSNTTTSLYGTSPAMYPICLLPPIPAFPRLAARWV